MEDKTDRLKLVLREGGEISLTIDATKNYAVNGAPDYDYMATYVRAVEEKILQRYREFVAILSPHENSVVQ